MLVKVSVAVVVYCRLVCEYNGQWFLEGATSWDYGCAVRMRYGVYAKVRYVKSWIDQTMEINQLSVFAGFGVIFNQIKLAETVRMCGFYSVVMSSLLFTTRPGTVLMLIHGYRDCWH